MNILDPVVAYDPVRASLEVILPANDPDAVMYADAVASAAVTRVDNDPDAVTKADEVASAAVTLVESEPDVEINVDAVDSVFVIRDDNEAENADVSAGKPAIDPENEPVIPCDACIVPAIIREPDTVGLY